MSLQMLPDEYRDRLVSEFQIATGKMAEAQDIQEYNYYFSAMYGEVVRVLNWHWDEMLTLIWSSLQFLHASIASRISAASQGDRAIVLPDQFFTSLTQICEALTDYIGRPGDEAELCHILGRMAKLAYASTGNGFYLLDKGVIKLES